MFSAWPRLTGAGAAAAPFRATPPQRSWAWAPALPSASAAGRSNTGSTSQAKTQTAGTSGSSARFGTLARTSPWERCGRRSRRPPGFDPRLTFLSTQLRDADLQRQFRELAATKLPFQIELDAWDDLLERINGDPVLRREYAGRLAGTPSDQAGASALRGQIKKAALRCKASDPQSARETLADLEDEVAGPWSTDLDFLLLRNPERHPASPRQAGGSNHGL